MSFERVVQWLRAETIDVALDLQEQPDFRERFAAMWTTFFVRLSHPIRRCDEGRQIHQVRYGRAVRLQVGLTVYGCVIYEDCGIRRSGRERVSTATLRATCAINLGKMPN